MNREEIITIVKQAMESGNDRFIELETRKEIAKILESKLGWRNELVTSLKSEYFSTPTQYYLEMILKYI